MRATAHVVGAVILLIAALFSFMSWVTETCTGNAPDSLEMALFIIPMNIAGSAILAWRPNFLAVALIALVPVMATFPYVGKAIQLLSGTPACDLVSPYGPWSLTGDETRYGILWLVCAVSLYLGIALALWRGYRPTYDQSHEQ